MSGRSPRSGETGDEAPNTDRATRCCVAIPYEGGTKNLAAGSAGRKTPPELGAKSLVRLGERKAPKRRGRRNYTATTPSRARGDEPRNVTFGTP